MALLFYMWENYETAKLAEGLSPQTLQKYRISLRLFQRWLVQTDSTPTPESIRRYLAYRQGQGRSASRVRNDWVALRSFYGWHKRAGYIDRNPMSGIPAPKLPKKIVDIYTDDEVHAILREVRSDEERAMITLYWKTGLRCIELYQLHGRDVDLQKRVMLIQGKWAKERLVPFDDECTLILKPYLVRALGGPVFLISLKSLRAALRYCLVRARVKARPRPIHCFRHTFATNFLQAGGNPLDLKYILGHASLAMVNYYVEISASNRAIEAYHRLFSELETKENGEQEPPQSAPASVGDQKLTWL